MNYQLIYSNLCNMCKNTSPEERLRRRQPTDARLADASCLYVEAHHVVPKHAGGTDNDDNIVVLLPEEHLFAHMVRFKAYKQRADFLAVRFILNGWLGATTQQRRKRYAEMHGASMLRQYGLYKQMIVGFRKTHGWHTEEGLKRISKARIGKIVCKDASTGEIIGAVPTNHQNVLDGLWVHHTTGTINVVDNATGKRGRIPLDVYRSNQSQYTLNRPSSVGASNNNYKEMTEDQRSRILQLVPRSVVDGCHFQVKTFEKMLKAEFSEFSKISTVWVLREFDTFTNLVDQYNKMAGDVKVKYDRWYRSSTQTQTAAEASSNKRWITDGVTNKSMKEADAAEFIKNNLSFRYGRTIK